MKKYLGMLMAVLFLGSFLLAPGLTAAVSDLDQYQTDGVGGNYISSHKFTGQSFKPTKNRLNKISIKMKGDGVKPVFAQMTKTGNDTLLLPGTPEVMTTADADYKWYDFTFADIAVTPGESYTFWVATYGSSFWAIHTSADELYADGKAYLDCPTWISNDSCDHWVATADWTFKTFGYSTTAPAPVTPPPVQPPVTTPTAAPTTVTTVAAPVLTELKKNNSIVTLPVTETVKVTKAGTLSLAGTSTDGGAVTVSYGEKSYPATTAADGTWKLEIVAKDLEVGEYTAKGKTVKGTTVSSEKELLKFSVEANSEPEVTNTKVLVADVTLYYAGAAGLLLLIAVILLIVYAVKHRKLKKHVETLGGTEAKAPKVTPAETLEEPKE